ncbi:hypothetical protein ACI65C_000842 [Semiaphis heraclei]
MDWATGRYRIIFIETIISVSHVWFWKLNRERNCIESSITSSSSVCSTISMSTSTTQTTKLLSVNTPRKRLLKTKGSESPKMVANEEAFDENSLAEANSKEQYKEMKRKLRLLVYENEIFQQTLKSTQRKLLKASRDKNVLLDRLIEYERVELSSSDDELTESSDEGDTMKPEPKKRKDPPANNSSSGTSKQSNSPQRTTPNPAKKRKPSTPKASKSTPMPLQTNESHSNSALSTAENSKTMAEPKSGNNFSQHSLATDMFNDTFSVKSESNSMYDIDTSPNNVAEDMISVDSIRK